MVKADIHDEDFFLLFLFFYAADGIDRVAVCIQNFGFAVTMRVQSTEIDARLGLVNWKNLAVQRGAALAGGADRHITVAVKAAILIFP